MAKFNIFFTKLLSFFRLAFSENGIPSSKRVLAGLIIIVILFCTVWSIIKYGMTENNRYIIEFEIVTAGALLGVSNITSIWKDTKNNIDSSIDKEIENNDSEEK